MKLFTSVVLILVSAMCGAQAFAAVSATASLSTSTTTINHPIAVTVTFRNGGSSQLTVTNVQLTATSHSNTSAKLPAAYSVWNQGPNASVTVAAGPNVTTDFGAGTVIFFSPSTGITGSGTGTYDIGGTIYTSDGSVTAISVGGRATVNPIPLPAYERQ